MPENEPFLSPTCLSPGGSGAHGPHRAFAPRAHYAPAPQPSRLGDLRLFHAAQLRSGVCSGQTRFEALMHNLGTPLLRGEPKHLLDPHPPIHSSTQEWAWARGCEVRAQIEFKFISQATSPSGHLAQDLRPSPAFPNLDTSGLCGLYPGDSSGSAWDLSMSRPYQLCGLEKRSRASFK